MKIYNTLSRKKEEFIPIVPGEAKIYACGPTVYNYIHIGNARPICVFDVLRRYLEYRGMKVMFVQNFTDIDDKIIRKANEENTDYLTVSKRYIEEYKTDATGLNVRPATVHPLATENIDEIIDIISTLVDKGYAYPAPNGDVYFRTLKDKEYGKLSHQPLDDLQSGARIAVEELKEDPVDFALWKGSKPGEPSWVSPWGDGRPGWHIECSAMARRYLGKTIDIHCGGQDLIFPHHENEIAQSECCNGVDFAHYWMHNGYINVDNKKMSKSLNNFFTVRDVAEAYGYEPIRFLMVSAHYRTPINYSVDVIDQCKASLERLYNCRENLVFLMGHAPQGEKEGEQEIRRKLESYRDQFIKAMEDDLNTADAAAALFDLAKEINTNLNAATAPSKELCSFALNLFNELADVLGLLYAKKQDTADEEIEKLISERNEARKEKNWAEADRIRDELKARHVVLEDTPNGIKWKITE
jgi:cysteinyl-tRNA synthetase